MPSERALRVAVIGAGPSGIYTADALSSPKTGANVSVDVLDRLPTPYGLVRYGVAPDHLKIKSVSEKLRQILERPQVRFVGNVALGRDVTVADLRRFYDAVVYAYGASRDRRLGVPGEDLAGSTSATEFVNWYCGHPDTDIGRYVLDVRSAVVVGVGNVAVDVARILAKTVDELSHTDLHDEVLDVLRDSKVTDVHMLGRRGPAQAKFTTKELRELGELADADVIVRPDELVFDEASEQALKDHKELARNVEVLREWSTRELTGKSRRIHVRFLVKPVEILGTDKVEGVVLERTALDGKGGVTGTGETETLPCQMVFRSVGYSGEAAEGVPFDDRTGVIPNEAGRVLRDGAVAVGEYTSGWIKRGPTGVIGTNRSDAAETVVSLLADAETLPQAAEPEPEAFPKWLAENGVRAVLYEHWEQIDAAERALGEASGRTRVKIPRLEDLLAAAHGA